MPAPETHHTNSNDGRASLGHVNLMVDTFIANTDIDDLRSIIRSLLATGPPHLGSAFVNTARQRLRQTNAKSLPTTSTLFARRPSDGLLTPTSELKATLARARSLYGAGMGFASFEILSSVVRATIGMRWQEDSDMTDILAVIDADISQAIQSSKEEIEGGRVSDLSTARDAVADLRRAVTDSSSDVKAWGGEFPFERASSSIEYWKL